MLIDFAQLVVCDLADEGRAQSEGGEPGRGIARRAAADLPPRPHRIVQAHCLGLIDQPHRALVESLLDRGMRSLASAMTSTIALPMQSTSKRGWVMWLKSCRKVKLRRA